jgi:hypothetical protein
MRLFAAIFLLTASLFAAPPAWQPANFRGLIVGRAHREDVLRALGVPDAVGPTRGGQELTYRGRGDHKGELSLRVDGSGIVVEIQEAFPVSITRTRIYKEFGSDAITAHFLCVGNALHGDPQGPIELTLFPARGIALWPDQYGYDFAAVLYLARAPGLGRIPSCGVGR